ncbi:JAB domain-containing protein [Pedobacter cryotolerans]|uniref:DNA repair protein n=1 Tax=Pedobacter cryotolerans TaxID=2571270 RepID=A0A4V5NX40_9SPHI|nr:JAB domain-containing protein [Pedobacter cryotolerans]TKB97300.1 DNA repair protein [Pedobacter cryotolerans]
MEQEIYQVAEVQISYHPKFKAQDRPKISQSEQAYQIFIHQWDKGKIELLEQCKVILLNRNNRVLGLAHISQGGVTGTVLDPRVIFSIALKANATSIVIAHNHPSGNLKPSNEDINITKQIVNGGKLLGIIVADHLVITNDSYYSLADNCLM